MQKKMYSALQFLFAKNYALYHTFLYTSTKIRTLCVIFVFAKNNPLCVTFYVQKDRNFALRFYIVKARHFDLQDRTTIILII